jgi:hypothetical protein
MILRSANISPGLQDYVDDIVEELKAHAVGLKLYYPSVFFNGIGDDEAIPMTALDLLHEVDKCAACDEQPGSSKCRMHTFASMRLGPLSVAT